MTAERVLRPHSMSRLITQFTRSPRRFEAIDKEVSIGAG
jgi:hypothetical protein